jgi:hypothetical protein
VSLRRVAAVTTLLALVVAGTARADEVLVLKDGRRIVVTRLARRSGKVRIQTKDGKVFEVPEDQVVAPALDSIPGTAPAASPPTVPATQERQVLQLRDGRRISVTRLARRGGRVRIETTDGKVFEIAESEVVSPALDTIPETSPAPAALETQGPQILALRDGRRITVTRLARRGRQVVFQTAKGEYFAVPEEQVVSPALASIPMLTPAAPGQPVAPTAPAVAPGPGPAPPLPIAAVSPVPPTPAQPNAGTQLSDMEFVPYPSRWDILDKLPSDPRLVRGRTIDPYNQNRLKGDKPIAGDSLFLVLTGTLEAPFESRRLPVASGVSAEDAGSGEFFGRGDQLFTSPRALLSVELFQGQTAFKPKTWAIKATAGLDLNYLRVQERNLVDIDVREGTTRRRQDVSLEEAFGEVLLATVSPHYDFISLRAGIQPFVSDFRGFIFSDRNLGARLFGNASSNRWQYNATYFDLLEKETNSELNLFEKRDQKVMVANLFRQDFLAPGLSLEVSYHRSQDDPTVHYDANGFLVRPAKVGSVRPHEVTSNYAGVAVDGHAGRLNVSGAYYYAFGTDSDQPIAGTSQDIRAHMAAAELSVDRDWLRLKGSFFWASGDDDARDATASGFDSIYDATNFAGGPFSFWSRSAVALTQTGVLLKAPGSLLPNLRSNKFEGQGSFVNPGLQLLGIGAEAALTPKVKAVLTANYLRFDKTGALQYLLFQPQVRKPIGIDLGGGVVWRPLLNENIVVTGGVTGLLPGSGFRDIYSSTCSVPGCGADSRTLLNAFVELKLTY